MTEEQRRRLEELREKYFREDQKASLLDNIRDVLPADSYTVLDPKVQKDIQLEIDSWPKDKWEKGLSVQTKISNPEAITTIINRFAGENPFDYSYVLLPKYLFVMLQVSNATLLSKWMNLIEVDGDDIFCYIPGCKEYICIEKVEEMPFHKVNSVLCWLYELTFSDEKLKIKLLDEGA